MRDKGWGMELNEYTWNKKLASSMRVVVIRISSIIDSRLSAHPDSQPEKPLEGGCEEGWGCEEGREVYEGWYPVKRGAMIRAIKIGLFPNRIETLLC